MLLSSKDVYLHRNDYGAPKYKTAEEQTQVISGFD